MLGDMRTLIDVDDELLRQAQAEAARMQTTLTALLEDALREKLSRSDHTVRSLAFELPVCPVPEGRWGLQAGFAWEELPYLDDDGGSGPW